MRSIPVLGLALALAAAAPAPAAADVAEGSPWSLTLSAWGGVTRYDVLGLKHGLSGVETQDAKALLGGNFDSWGGSALLRLGWLDLGALYEGSFRADRTETFVLTPLAGIAWRPSELLRVDLLAELGGHQVSNIGSDLDVQDARSVWLPYVGARPTLSFRLPLGPTRLVLSAAAFARWDLVRKETSVTGTSGTQVVYDVGGTTFGLVGGVGIEL